MGNIYLDRLLMCHTYPNHVSIIRNTFQIIFSTSPLVAFCMLSFMPLNLFNLCRIFNLGKIKNQQEVISGAPGACSSRSIQSSVTEAPEIFCYEDLLSSEIFC